MARLNIVKSFRGTTKTTDGELTCGICRDKITKGDGYKWWANRLPGSRGSIRQIRCMKADCAPSRADMTPGRAGDLLRLQDDGHSAIDGAQTVDDLLCTAESLADEVTEMADGLTESADNIEDGFGHETYQSGELRERAENMESYADDLRNVDLDDDETDEDEIRQELEEDDEDDTLTEQDVLDAINEARENHVEEQREKVREALDAVEIY